MPKLRETLSGLLRSGQVNTRRRGRFELHKSRLLTVVGDTNASYGYAYLAAWMARSDEADQLAGRAMDVIDRAVTEAKLPG